MNAPLLAIHGLSKRFVLHNLGGTELPVLGRIDLQLHAGQCIVLHGPSGAGKSTLLRMVYGNYRTPDGRILVRDGDGAVDIATATPREILGVRRRTMGYVSQFLRVIPRVPALEIVAEPLMAEGMPAGQAQERAAAMLERLNIPGRLWGVPPATFSGGEQQRINIARGFIRRFPLLLLDEPTAALDADNRAIVAGLINEARKAGAGILGIFHDEDTRQRVASHLFPMHPPESAT